MALIIIIKHNIFTKWNVYVVKMYFKCYWKFNEWNQWIEHVKTQESLQGLELWKIYGWKEGDC